MPSQYSEAARKQVSKWTVDTRITLKPDAKRPGSKSFDRYQSYVNARCVGEALKLGAKPEDLLHDYSKQFLSMKKDQRIKNPPGLFSDKEKAIFEKFLSHMKAGGVNIKKHQLKTNLAIERLKKLGIDMKDLRSEKNGQEDNDMQAMRLSADCAASEILTDIETNNRKVTEKDMMTVLNLWAFRRNEARLNVLPEGKTWVNSDTLGLIRDRKGDFIITNPTKDYPHFMSLLNKYLQDHKPKEWAHDFPYTTISLNYGYAAKRHRDKGNHGPSMIRAFGKFKGGELCYWPDDNHSQSLDELREEDKVELNLSKGLALFDGNRAHQVESFQGERFSIVWFTVERYWKAKEEILDALRERGYAVPTEQSNAMVRTMLPPPRGYHKCHSLASMLGFREKPLVYQWSNGEVLDLSKPKTAPVNLKAMLGVVANKESSSSSAGNDAGQEASENKAGEEKPSEEKPSEEKPSEEKPSGEKPSGEKPSEEKVGEKAPEEGSQSPKREERQPQSKSKESPKPAPKRPTLFSSKKAKKARKEVAPEEASMAQPKVQPEAAPEAPAEPMEDGEEPPAASKLALEDFAAEKLEPGVAWCSRLSALGRALLAAEDAEETVVPLCNYFRAVLFASEEPFADLSHALELMLVATSDSLPQEAAEALRKVGEEDEASQSPLTLAQARAEWRAAKSAGDEAAAHFRRLLRAAGGADERRALAKMLQGDAKTAVPEVLSALGRAFAVTQPSAEERPAQPRAFASAEGRQARIAAMDKALLLAHGETGGQMPLLLRELLAGRSPAELFGRCGVKCGQPVLCERVQELDDREVLLNDLCGSAVLVEQLYAGESVQVHKLADGCLSVKDAATGAAVSPGEDVMSALKGAVQAKECVLEAVLQRGCVYMMDCLFLDGKSLTRRSFRERRAALERSFAHCDAVQLPLSEEFPLEEPLSAEVLTSLLDDASSCGSRGLLVRRMEREYEAGHVSTAGYAFIA